MVTDRKVMDKQLQHTITQLEQTQGVVNNVDRDSGHLREFLEHTSPAADSDWCRRAKISSFPRAR